MTTLPRGLSLEPPLPKGLSWEHPEDAPEVDSFGRGFGSMVPGGAIAGTLGKSVGRTAVNMAANVVRAPGAVAAEFEGTRGRLEGGAIEREQERAREANRPRQPVIEAESRASGVVPEAPSINAFGIQFGGSPAGTQIPMPEGGKPKESLAKKKSEEFAARAIKPFDKAASTIEKVNESKLLKKAWNLDPNRKLTEKLKDPRWWLQDFSEGASSAVAFLAPGIAGAKGASMLGASTQTARAIGFTVSSAMLTAAETGGAFNEMRRDLEAKGYTEGEAALIASRGAVAYGVASGLVERGILPAQFTQKAKNWLVKRLVGAAGEVTEEEAQMLLMGLTRMSAGLDPELSVEGAIETGLMAAGGGLVVSGGVPRGGAQTAPTPEGISAQSAGPESEAHGIASKVPESQRSKGRADTQSSAIPSQPSSSPTGVEAQEENTQRLRASSQESTPASEKQQTPTGQQSEDTSDRQLSAKESRGVLQQEQTVAESGKTGESQSLEGLSYRELQSRARALGVKANQSKPKLVEGISKAEQSDTAVSQATTEPTPKSTVDDARTTPTKESTAPSTEATVSKEKAAEDSSSRTKPSSSAVPSPTILPEEEGEGKVGQAQRGDYIEYESPKGKPFSGAVIRREPDGKIKVVNENGIVSWTTDDKVFTRSEGQWWAAGKKAREAAKSFGLERPSPQPSPPQAEKQPWEMTREEVSRESDQQFAQRGPAVAENAEFERRTRENDALIYHKGQVQRALQEGKPVPPEVLKDYPELAEKYTQKESQDALRNQDVPQAQEAQEEGREEAVEPPSRTIKRAEGEESPEDLTSARKVDMDRDRKALGLDELDSPDRRSWRSLLENAGDGTQAMRLASEVADKGRAFNDQETATVTVHAARLKNEHERLTQEIGATEDAADIASLSAEINRVEQEFDILSQSLRASGTEKGRALASQKLTIDKDFALVSVLARAKASKGAALSEVQRDKFEKLIAELEQKAARVSELEQQVARLEAQKRATSARNTRSKQPPAARHKKLEDLYGKANELLKAGCR